MEHRSVPVLGRQRSEFRGEMQLGFAEQNTGEEGAMWREKELQTVI